MSYYDQQKKMSKAERKKRMKAAVERQMREHPEWYDGSVVTSPTAGLTRENFAKSTEGYTNIPVNNQGVDYRYTATRELGIPDQIDPINPEYAAKDRVMYNRIDNPVTVTSGNTPKEIWAQIYGIMGTDPQRGRQLMEQAKSFESQYGNPLYSPYKSSTISQDIKDFFGQDSFDMNWISDNAYLAEYISRKVNGDVKAPTSKSSQEEWAGYYFAQIMDAESATQQAETEYAQLRQDIMKAVKDSKDLGLDMTVNEIIDSLDVSANYKTLTSMMDSKGDATPKKLNRAVGYDSDDLYGMVQAAMDGEDITQQTDFRAASARYVKRHQEQELYDQFLEEEKKRIEEANPVQAFALRFQDIRMRAADPSKPGRFKGDGKQTDPEITHAIEEALSAQDTPQKEKIKIDVHGAPDTLQPSDAYRANMALSNALEQEQRNAAKKREAEEDAEHAQHQAEMIDAFVTANPTQGLNMLRPENLDFTAPKSIEAAKEKGDTYRDYVDSIDADLISKEDQIRPEDKQSIVVADRDSGLSLQGEIDRNLRDSAGDTISDDRYAVYKKNREMGYSYWQLDPQTFEVLPYYSSPNDPMPTVKAGFDESQEWAAKENYVQWQSSVLGIRPWEKDWGENVSTAVGKRTTLGLERLGADAADAFSDKSLRKNPTDIEDANAEVSYIVSNPDAYIPDLMAAIQETIQSGEMTADQRHIISMFQQGVDFDDMIQTGVGNWTNRAVLKTAADEAQYAYSMVDVLAAFGLVDQGVISSAHVMTNTDVQAQTSIDMQTGNWLIDHVVNPAVVEGGAFLAQVGLASLSSGLSGIYSAANEAGMAMEDARQKGANRQQQAAMGLVGAIVGASDIIPINSILGKSGKALDYSSRGVGTIFRDAGINALKEGGQEVAQDITTSLFARSIYDKDMKFFSVDPSTDAVINLPQLVDSFVVGSILGGSTDIIVNSPRIGDAIKYSHEARSGEKNSVIIGHDPENGSRFIVSDRKGNPIVFTEAEANLLAHDSDGILEVGDVSKSEVIKAANREIELLDIQDVNAVVADPKARGMLDRALHGLTSKDDLDAFEAGIELTGNEQVSQDLSRAASAYKKLVDRAEKAESAYQVAQDRIADADAQISAAQAKVSEHIAGTVLMQQGQTIGSVAVEKASLAQRIERAQDDADLLEAAGVEHAAQDQALEQLNTMMDDVETRLSQLKTAGHPMSEYTARVQNASNLRRNLDQGLAQAEKACTEAMEASHKGYIAFQQAVASGVDTLFGINGKERIGASVAVDTQLRAEANDRQLEAGLAREAQAGQVAQDMQRVNLEENLPQPWDGQPDPLAPETEETVDTSSAVDAIDDSHYKDIKSYLKNARISLSETQRQEASSAYDSYGAYRNALWGKTNLTNDGTPLDVVWQELSGMYPDIFPADVSEGEQVRVLRDVMDRIYAKPRSEQTQYSMNISEYTDIDADADVLPSDAPQVKQEKRAAHKRLKSMQQAMIDAAKALGIGLQQGGKHYSRPLKNKTKGYYRKNSHGVNVKLAADIDTFSHEAGHHLDNQYGLQKAFPGQVDHMVDALPESFQSAYNNDRAVLRGEAIAEFVRMYITDETKARAFSGSEFFTGFVERLSDADKRTLENLRSAYHSFIDAPVTERIRSVIQSNGDKKKDDGLSFNDRMITYLSDSYHPLRIIDQEINERLNEIGKGSKEYLGLEGLAKNAIYSQNVADSLINSHMFTPDGETVYDIGSLKDCFAGLKGRADYDTLIEYMVAKHAMADWALQGKAVFPELISSSEATSFIQGIETNRPDIVEAQQKIIRYWDAFMQNWVVNEGFLPQETYDMFKKLNPNYVPLQRVMDVAGISRKGEGTNNIFTLKRSAQEGSTRDIYDPIESMYTMIHNAVSAQRQNAILLELDRLYQEVPGLSYLIMPANKDMNSESVNISEVLDRYIKESNENINDADKDMIGLVMDMLRRKDGGGVATIFKSSTTASGDRIINVVRPDGTIASYEVQAPALYNALLQLDTGGLRIPSALSKTSRVLVSLLTEKNPLFLLPNAVRDTQNLLTMGSENNPAKALQNIGKAAFIKLFKKNDDRYRQYLAMGGGAGEGEAGMGNPSSALKLKKNLVKGYHSESALREIGSMFQTLSDKAAAVGNFVEDNTRFAEFLGALEKYGTDQNGRALSFRRSRTATTEFAVSGSKMRGWSTLFRFMNATWQGTSQQIRQLTDKSTGNRSSKVIRLAALNTVLGTATEILLRSIWGDQEEYEALPSEIRNAYWCIPASGLPGMEDGDYIRLPKAQGLVTATFGLPQVLAAGFMNGDLNDELTDALWGLLGEVNLFSSPAWAHLWEAATNKTYYGSSIVSESMKDLPLGMQYDDTTSQWAIKAANWINTLSSMAGKGDIISPKKLEYVAEQYSGVVGKIATPLAYDYTIGFDVNDPLAGLRNLGQTFLNRMTINPYYTNDAKTEYRDTKDRLNEILTTFNRQLDSSELNYELTDDERQQAIIELDRLLKSDEGIKGLDEKITAEWDAIRELAENETLSDDQVSARTLEHRKNILQYQLMGNMAMETWMEKYGPRKGLDAIRQKATSKSAPDKAETKWIIGNEGLPESLTNQSESDQMKSMQQWYIDTGSTTFVPKYPPDFTEDGVVPWDDVDDKTKSAMERIWTQTLLDNLKKLPSAKDEKEAKDIAGTAKRKATSAVKEIYLKRYKIKDQ